MKKTIFGLALMLSGIIGFSGWVIACTNIAEAGAWSGITGNLHGFDLFISIIFTGIAIIGLLIAFCSVKNGKFD